MAMTAAERQKKRRQKLKDEGKYDEYKKYHKTIMQKSRDKYKTKIKKLTEYQQQELKRKNRLAIKKRVAKHRALKGKNSGKAYIGVPETPAFKNAATLGKAVAKAKRALPTTPKRREAVIRKLFNKGLADIKEPQKRCSGICNETIELVENFFQRDDISRQAPGIKDVVTIRSNGVKSKIQARHLMYSLKEAYNILKSENPDISIGKSKFAEFRPKHVLLSSKLPHNVCLCKYHENFICAVNTLHKIFDNIPKYTKEFPLTLLCNDATDICWLNKCTQCQNGEGYKKNYHTTESLVTTSQVTWYVWRESQDGRVLKAVEDGTSEELENHLIEMIPKFLEHCYIKRAQAQEYKLQREASLAISNNFNSKIGLMQIDFSENYTCMYQDEIQSAHWQQSQVSLFTASIWYFGTQHPTVIVSDNLNHSKDCIVAYLDRLIDTIPENINLLRIWSDGPSSQFKNKFIAAVLPVLQDKHKIKIIWNYFATSHGKGPVDGIGGALKRQVWTSVKQRLFTVRGASSFLTTAKKVCTVDVIEMKQDEIEERNKSLNVAHVFSNAIQYLELRSNTVCTTV